MKEAAENIGDNDGMVYCLMEFPFMLHCCVVTVLGDKIAEKRGIPNSCMQSALSAYCDCCVCYSCTIVNESRMYKAERQAAGADGAVKAQAMERK